MGVRIDSSFWEGPLARSRTRTGCCVFIRNGGPITWAGRRSHAHTGHVQQYATMEAETSMLCVMVRSAKENAPLRDKTYACARDVHGHSNRSLMTHLLGQLCTSRFETTSRTFKSPWRTPRPYCARQKQRPYKFTVHLPPRRTTKHLKNSSRSRPGLSTNTHQPTKRIQHRGVLLVKSS